MKRTTITLLWTLMLAACNTGDKKTASGFQDPFDRAGMDTTVRPQDNFFLYANGGWLKTAVIPPSRSSWGIVSLLQDTILARLRFLLDSVSAIPDAPANSPARQTGDLYFSAMDSAAIEQKKWQPVKVELDRIDSLRKGEDIWDEIAAEFKIKHDPFFSFSVSPDEKNSRINFAHFDQGGLGMPNRDYYFKKDSSIIVIRNAYQDLVKKLFLLSGADSGKSTNSANAVMAIETALAKCSKSPLELRDPQANYHKITRSSFNKLFPGSDRLLTKMSIPGDTVLVGQPDFYKGLTLVLSTSSPDDIKSYLKFHVLFDYAYFLSSDFVQAAFAYRRLLNGQKEMQKRWELMTGLVDERLGDALGQLYVAKYFPPQAKQRILDLVNNIMDVYADRIEQLDWMSDSTKKKALLKLHAIEKKIGYPDSWKDYTSIHIAKDDLIANLRSTSAYEYQRDINKIGKPVDRLEWFLTPPTIDAYYDPTQNNINFPAGILQPPFFYADGDDAINYGGIGIVIGHEFTHGFDDQGRQFDADGNLNDWWSAKDAAQFNVRAENVVRQYNQYIPVDTFHINGRLTEGENLADCGGVALAYAAFKKTPEGKSDSLINGFTPDQRFFLNLAMLWRNKKRMESLRSQVLNDPHSAPMFRVNGPVSNMTAFYDAFHVQPTDSMYRPDSLRVRVW